MSWITTYMFKSALGSQGFKFITFISSFITRTSIFWPCPKIYHLHWDWNLKIPSIKQLTLLTFTWRKSLWYIQTPPHFWFDGWSTLINLYPCIRKLSSSNNVPWLRCVSNRHIVSVVCIALYAFKREILGKLWTAMLFRFQWQIEKLWPELGLGPGFDLISPHSISKSNFPEKFSEKLARSLK